MFWLCVQFERTLIIAEDDSQVSYLEGCTAPSYDTNQVHSFASIYLLSHEHIRSACSISLQLPLNGLPPRLTHQSGRLSLGT